MAKVLELQLQHQFFQCIFRADSFRIDWLDLLAVSSCWRRVFSNNTVQKHQCFSAHCLYNLFLESTYGFPPYLYLIHGQENGGLPRWLSVKNLPASAETTGEMSSIPALGRSPGVGSGNHSRILAWKIPWEGEPGRGYSRWGHEDTTERLSTH